MKYKFYKGDPWTLLKFNFYGPPSYSSLHSYRICVLWLTDIVKKTISSYIIELRFPDKFRCLDFHGFITNPGPFLVARKHLGKVIITIIYGLHLEYPDPL